ncbi:hypothetical protein CCACVL1_06979 [Corchorus capsularis]|uniref:Uncharacterized protein n=1 Tax=Corchorus capsularis TaxID=210143 RepID=A0A1R3JAL2_COCAP|nr:hypothetical protein CCACVL1_06979 [Corchorus capsularis]
MTWRLRFEVFRYEEERYVKITVRKIF